MLLSEIIPHVDVEQIKGPEGVSVSGVSCDSRKVLPGHVFVAIPGQKHDGVRFVQGALERGAVAVVQESPLEDTQNTAARIRVQNARKAMAQMARCFHGFPDRRLSVIGMTGTNGKTTTTYIIKHLLDLAGIKSGLIGTVLYDDGQREIPASRTTPESSELYSMMGEMLEHGCRACVMEVSSHALEQGRVEGIDFDIAIFSNLTQDHLDYHKTFEAYFDAKSLLFEGLCKEEKKAWAIVNVDDAHGRALISRVAPGAEVLTYAIEGNADFKAQNLMMESLCCRYDLCYKAEIYPVLLPLTGRYNIYNSLAAIASAVALGIPLLKTIEALANIPVVPGRLERVCTELAINVFVDYAHTDDALKNVLLTLRETAPRKIITVFGCGGNRDEKKRALMGRIAADLSDLSIITSDNPRQEDPAKILSQIVEGFDGKSNFEIIEDRKEAIFRALQVACPGDTVLVAGKGHETYQEFADEVIPFDDRVVVQELAQELSAQRGGF